MIVETEIDLGGRVAPVRARINKRARRLILRVDSLTGIVHLTSPSKRALPEAMRFARERALWIKEQLSAGPVATQFEEGGLCPYRGVNHVIKRQGAPRSRIKASEPHTGEEPELTVGGEAEHLNRRLVEWLKRQARQTLVTQSDYYCDKLGVRRGKIRIGDTRTRWGSCSEDGTLSYSWRLILAPSFILDYVAAHECTHLVHLNHSPAYWRLLATLNVDAREAKDWFQDYGDGLFAWGGVCPKS